MHTKTGTCLNPHLWITWWWYFNVSRIWCRPWSNAVINFFSSWDQLHVLNTHHILRSNITRWLNTNEKIKVFKLWPQKNDRWAMFRRQKYREISRGHCIFYIYIPCLRIRKKHVLSSCISISAVWKLISAYLQLIFNQHFPNYLCQIIWLKIHTLSKTLGIEDNRVAKHRHLVVDNYHNPVTI